MINDNSSAGGTERVLLVDDHAGFRKTVRDFLPGDRLEVIECGDGAEAVELYKELRPAWTLMDVQMPGLDGLKATRLIRSHFPEARIIMLTEHDSAELREEAGAAGACAYVLKDRLCDLPNIIKVLSQGPSPNRNPDSPF